MGCFNICFGSCKDDNSQTNRNKKVPKNQRYGMQNADERKTLIAYRIPEKQCVPEERFRASPTNRRVTFNSNVKIYEPVLVCDSTDSLLGEDKVREEFKENIVKLKDDDSGSGNDSITSSVGAYPQNHRYQNCQESDDEAEEYGDSDLDDDEGDGDDVEGNGDDDVGRFTGCQDQEVCPESVVTELEELRTKNPSLRVNSEEVNSPFKAPSLADEGNRVKAGYARGRTHIHPVLNPVENLTQWKALKSKGTPLSLKPQKENSTADVEAPQELTYKFKHLSSSPKAKSKQLKTSDQDVAVDASLSYWLVSPYTTTPVKKTNRSSGVETFASARSGSQCSNSVW